LAFVRFNQADSHFAATDQRRSRPAHKVDT
jgi:hypothetical protein